MQRVAAINKIPPWKKALWEKNSIEPALLRVPIAIVVFIIFWGINVWLLDRMRLQYHNVLSIKSASLSFIFITGFAIAIHYALNMTIFSNALGLTVETGVLFFYILLTIILLIPNAPGVETRGSFYKLCRLLIIPASSITFPEVLLADALTSMSKVLKDFGVSLFAIYAQLTGIEIILFHNNAMITIAMLASIPFLIRVRQCWIQYDGAADSIARIPILLNIIKYISAFPPIWLTAASALGYENKELPNIIAFAATINSIYSFMWDTIMDWGLLTITRDGKTHFRQRMYFPTVTYVIVVILNLLLRFSWAMNRLPGLNHLHSSVLVLVIELGEILRRSIWNIFRIEWEIIVTKEKELINGIPLSSTSKEKDEGVGGSNNISVKQSVNKIFSSMLYRLGMQ